ncbi:MAG TPA: class I SAM-dependent methyltransferase [Thermoleophilaceae bacterium]
MPNTETRTPEQFYSHVETANLELNPRLRVFIDEYRRVQSSAGRPLRVLDVGCGRRALLSKEVAGVDEYWGCDIAPDQEVDLDHYRRVDINERSLKELFDGRFDVIFCGEVVEHVFNPDALIADLRDMLADGGVLVLSTPNLGYWLNRLMLLVGISPFFLENSAHKKLGRRFTFFGQGNETQGHIRLFTYRAMRDLAADLGLRLVRARAVPVWANPVDRLICRVSRSLSPDVVYVLVRR